MLFDYMIIEYTRKSFTSSPSEVSINKVFLKISQNSEENTCVGDLFLV